MFLFEKYGDWRKNEYGMNWCPWGFLVGSEHKLSKFNI